MSAGVGHTVDERTIRDAAFDLAPDPMLVLDAKGCIIAANAKARGVIAARGAMIRTGFDFLEFHSANVGEDETEALREVIRQAFTEEKFAPLCIPATSNPEHAIEIETRALVDEEDSLIGVLFVVHDISEHVMAERRLAEAAERHRQAECNARDQAAELERKAALLDLSQDAIFMKDADDRIVYWSSGAQGLFGYCEGEALGKPSTELLDTHFVGDTRESVEAQLHRLGRWEGELRQRTKDGREIFTSGRWALRRGSNGEGDSILETNTDLTRQLQAAVELEQAHQLLRARVEELEEYNRQITLLGEMGELMQNCPTAAEAYEVASRYIPQMCPTAGGGALYVVAPSRDVAERVSGWGPCMEGAGEFQFSDCWGLRRSQTHLVVDPPHEMMCAHVYENHGPYACIPMIAQGEVLGVLHLQMDDLTSTAVGDGHHTIRVLRGIAEQLALTVANLRMHDSLQSLSVRDPLTGLYNRRFMEASLERELGRAERHGTMVAVIMLDVDHFKDFNDRFGHEAGDDVLRGLGQLLRTQTRPEDIACRYGGEEFLLIMPNADIETAVGRTEALRDAIAATRLGSIGDGTITASFGISTFPEHGRSIEELVRQADSALYEAKNSGRNRVRTAPLGATGER